MTHNSRIDPFDSLLFLNKPMNSKTIIYLTVAITAIAPISRAELLTAENRQNPLPIRNVHLTDHFWLPKIETIQNHTIKFALDKCEAEGRMENFLIAGGELEGETRGAMPFDDTDLYKIIEGASNSLISVPDAALEKRLDVIIETIAKGQEADGYLTTWRTIDGFKPPAPWVKPGPRWFDLNSSHELYNAGHLFEAAAVHHAATGKDNLLNIALGYADLLVSTFGKGKLETVPGHQIVETGLIKLYRITGNKDYLELARYFLEGRGVKGDRKLYGPYSQDHIPVIEQREVVGHAVRAVYMYAGMTQIAELYQDQAYFDAVEGLWNNMVQRKLYITGGIGARHEGESFGDDYELPNLTAYAETCAALGSIVWNHLTYQITGDTKYYDIIERTLYNGLLSGISHDGTHFFYPNCLEADKKFAFNQGNHTRAEWFDCSCCPTNMIRFLPSIPELIYTRHDHDLSVNLYASNHAEFEIEGIKVTVELKTLYPWEGKVSVSLIPEQPRIINLRLRIPGWTQNKPVPGDLYEYTNAETGEITLALNGEPLAFEISNGYISIERIWRKEDKIVIDFPMNVKKVVANEKVKSLHGKVALERGPLVYCFEEPDNNIEVSDIVIEDDAKFLTKNMNLFGGIMAIEGKTSDGRPIKAIPYYAWSNRGVTSMKVWVPMGKKN